jgi:phenylacetate-CoA ligase
LKPTPEQLALVRERLRAAKENSRLYAEKLRGIDPGDIRSAEDFRALPFTEKSELRDGCEMGVCACGEEEVVRIHMSSGTTGVPIVIPYTAKDVDDWAEMFARCYRMAGLTRRDRVQITPGYGLWTAGIGFQAGCERLGAMAIPIGPGNTERQLNILVGMRSTVLCATSSYALLIAEEVERRGLEESVALRKAIIGSECWGDKMRQRIGSALHVELYDIYGLTEVYGPGIAISCGAGDAMHYWDDFLYLEIIDPATGEVLPDGEMGEIAITTLRKQAAPLIRYRTHDLSRILPEPCPCGANWPRIARIAGRSDDRIKVRGVNIYPGQILDVLSEVEGVSSEYQVRLSREGGKDEMALLFEVEPGFDPVRVAEEVARAFRQNVGLRIRTEGVEIGALPRSEKKTVRVIDQRH